MMARAMPPRTRIAENSRRTDTTSASMRMPAAGGGGTASGATEACTAARLGSAAYQTTYPSPDATAPDATASATPLASTWADGNANIVTMPSMGSARTKLPVVCESGFAEVRPRNEYKPQQIPAMAISSAAVIGG